MCSAAAHYPSGAFCYDCHSVSKSKMVVGTHLIKKSQKTVDLGITGSSTPIRCLFCHEKNAVSAPFDANRFRVPGDATSGYKMAGALDHFDSTSLSQHRAALQSSFTASATTFDCLDCHTGISAGVVTDGAGNASVHGKDAGTEAVDLYATLVGSPGGRAGVSSSTCQSPSCHDADGGAAGGYSAPPGHSVADATVNDGAAPTACTQCHGTHNSYQNTSLIVLRDDGSTLNIPGAPLGSRVTPEKCGECHSQDDAGIYTARGHGQSGISGGALTCTSCHTGTVPHRFSRAWPGTNGLRFGLSENTSAQSSLRAQPPYQQAYSICLTCHSQFVGKLHQGPTDTAGCNDCHEPHGMGVGANAKMIRAQVPKVDAAGTPVYGDGSGAAYDINTYAAAGDAVYKADGTSLCDNAECHQGRTVNGDLIHPLASLLTAGRHSGGDRPAVDACDGCHTHADSGGGWGAKNACSACHGQPPPAAASGYSGPDESATAHRRHAGSGAGQYGYGCTTCHSAYPSGHRDGTYQSVAFGSLNPGGSYASGARTCADLYCHGTGQSAASTGSAPAWESGALSCRGCHGGIDAGARIATGSHAEHLAWAQITCVSCHAETVAAVATDATTAITGTAAHVNGVKNLRAGGSFAGAAVAFAPGEGACTQISCHGGSDATWGATLSCANCHLRPATDGGDQDSFASGDAAVAAASAEEWAGAGHGRASAFPSGNPAASFAGPATDPQGCAYCHDAGVSHGLPTNPLRLANRSGTAEDNGWNNVCLVCHRSGDAGRDPDGAGDDYAGRNGARNVDENHYGAKHADPARGGTFCWDCHDPHGDGNAYMVHSGDGSAPGRGVTAASDGTYGLPTSSMPVTGFAPASAGYTSEDLANPADTGLCQTCHAASGGAKYYNRGTFTPLAGHNGADAIRCSDCHRHGNGFVPSCSQCHDDGGASGAPQVAAASPHTDADGAGSNYTAGACPNCHPAHSGGVAIPPPPTSWADPSGRMTGTNMRTRLGIDYSSHGGIRLGGPGAVPAIRDKTTEAEICWGCHESVGVSEWGYNADTNGATFPVLQLPTPDGQEGSVHFGWIYSDGSFGTRTSDWSGAPYWRSPYQPQITGRIVSIHTATFDPSGQSSSVESNVDANGLLRVASPVLEARGHIRCSYCHDVHDTFGPNGRPRLRGTWMGNPYPPDIVPWTNWGTNGPRMYVTSALPSGDGYYIDRNSGQPTAGRTLGDAAGLCTLCHGTDVDQLDYYTGSRLWLLGNGHSNACLGGTGALKSDLFDARRPEMASLTMGRQSEVPVFGSKSETVMNSGWYGGVAGADTKGPDYDLWYAAGAVPTLPHAFPCSKCHTPHASSLPALLVTRCIDTGYPASPAYGLMRQARAQNCHRKTTKDDGWHRLAEGQ